MRFLRTRGPLGTPSLEARNPVQLCKVALSLTGDGQRRLLCLMSIALTAVMPTSIRMAASKTKTIKGVLLVLPKDVQVCRQWLAIALPLREVTKPGNELTQISCTYCTGTGSIGSLVAFSCPAFECG